MLLFVRFFFSRIDFYRHIHMCVCVSIDDNQKGHPGWITKQESGVEMMSAHEYRYTCEYIHAAGEDEIEGGKGQG